jgi:hypothetical protein
MSSDSDKGVLGRLSKRFSKALRVVSRFGRVNARAYAAILRAVVTERLWSVPPRGQEVSR